MSILRFGPSVTQVVNVSPGDDYSFFPCTEWMPSSAVETVRITLGARADGSQTFSMTPAIQYASVSPDVPGTWSTAGTAFTTERNLSADVSVTPGNGFWVRVGYGVRNTSSTSTNPTTLSLTTSFESNIRGKGEVLIRQKLTLFPNHSGDQFVPVGGWYPALGISHLRAAMVLTSRNTDSLNNIQVAMAWRYGDNVNDPNIWQGPGSFHTVASANEMWETGEVAVTTTSPNSPIAFQPGVRFKAASGAKSQIEVEVVLVGKWA